VSVATLALTGGLDGCMDTRLHDLAMKPEDFPAGLRVVRVEGAGHFLHQEMPEEVNGLLLDWLAR
jgi:pimeloyl-ACP methyl ester carboxylesterase